MAICCPSLLHQPFYLPVFIPLVYVHLEIAADPAGQTFALTVCFLSFFSLVVSLKYSHSVRSAKLWDEQHNHQQIPSYLAVWYVWTYFHMLWTVPDSKPTAAHYQQTLAACRYFRFRAVICHSTIIFSAIFLPGQDPPTTEKSMGKEGRIVNVVSVFSICVQYSIGSLHLCSTESL